MIVIWHNGGSYSDRRIYFIDIGEAPLPGVLVAFASARLCTRADLDNSRVLLTAPEVKWRDPAAMMTLTAFADEADNYGMHGDDCPSLESFEAKDCNCWLAGLREVSGAE